MANKIVENIISSIELITEPGIDSEIQHFLRSCDDVIEFSVEINESKYYIDLILKNSNLHDIKNHFLSFVAFMQYSYFTFYTRRADDNLIVYRLISGGSDMKGFYCELTYEHL
ncbi:hypothetical protein [Budvicia diplopodorum]|uniref:hypothetical protein n=1 Tax=Budvicia diplopodorum TaxID=1119056 RepID=UPI001359C058|nr:hypothetical protein [Budvicia diplopodorum]